MYLTSVALIAGMFVDVDPEKASRGGWAFTSEVTDPVFGCNDLREVYEMCYPGFKGRYGRVGNSRRVVGDDLHLYIVSQYSPWHSVDRERVTKR